MNIKHKLLLLPVGMLLLAVANPSHARGGVYGNVGYNDYPWSILIGYSDYGHGYNRGHRHSLRCGHGKRYYKHTRHHYKHRNYRHHYGHRDRHHYQDRRYYKRDRHHYDKYRDRRHHVKQDRHYDRGHDNHRGRDSDRSRDRRDRDRNRDRR